MISVLSPRSFPASLSKMTSTTQAQSTRKTRHHAQAAITYMSNLDLLTDSKSSNKTEESLSRFSPEVPSLAPSSPDPRVTVWVDDGQSSSDQSSSSLVASFKLLLRPFTGCGAVEPSLDWESVSW